MYRSSTPRQRTAAALAAAVLVAGLGVLLVLGLQVRLLAPKVSSLVAISLQPARPVQTESPPRHRLPAPHAAQAPTNRLDPASPVLAALNIAPPVIAASSPAAGSAAQSGAADRAGAGNGAGGAGNGSGGGGGVAIEPQQIRGRLSVDDFPFGLIGPGERASVRLSYVVETDGRVTTCRIERSSGFAQVDAMACRLIEQRFRYRPARNAAGDPVKAAVEETHTWFRRP